MSRGTNGFSFKMNHPKWTTLLVGILHLSTWRITGSALRISASTNNCTCRTNSGTYSLMPLRNTDHHTARFQTKDTFGWTYTYNPCTPYTFESKKGSCKDVALCKYDTTGDPRDYYEIGMQKRVLCEEDDGKLALIYHINDPNIPVKQSKVFLECNDNPQADPSFKLLNKDNNTFTLSSLCGCPNRCLPSSLLSTSSTINPTSLPTKDLNWELLVLLPSVGAACAVVALLVCLYLLLVDRPQYRCCHCCGYRRGIRGLIAEERDYGAVEHEENDREQELNAPVQAEDGVVAEECDAPEYLGKKDFV